MSSLSKRRETKGPRGAWKMDLKPSGRKSDGMLMFARKLRTARHTWLLMGRRSP